MLYKNGQDFLHMHYYMSEKSWPILYRKFLYQMEELYTVLSDAFDTHH